MSIRFEDLVETIKKAKELSKSKKFIQSYELIVKLKDVDFKQPENRFSELIQLPNPPLNKLAKVAVIADGDMALKAREAGADAVVTRDVLEKTASSKKDAKKIARTYDIFIAQSDLMPIVGRSLGRYLGPRGKMPQPVPSTVDLKPLIERAKKSVRVRVRDQPQIQCKIGSESQDPKEVGENALAVINFLLGRFKLHNIEKVYIKLTMGPPVKVE
ncbi:MAG: 50S ribosomal protein L1 [Thermofilaceae archaeon]